MHKNPKPSQYVNRRPNCRYNIHDHRATYIKNTVFRNKTGESQKQNGSFYLKMWKWWGNLPQNGIEIQFRPKYWTILVVIIPTFDYVFCLEIVKTHTKWPMNRFLNLEVFPRDFGILEKLLKSGKFPSQNCEKQWLKGVFLLFCGPPRNLSVPILL